MKFNSCSRNAQKIIIIFSISEETSTQYQQHAVSAPNSAITCSITESPNIFRQPRQLTARETTGQNEILAESIYWWIGGRCTIHQYKDFIHYANYSCLRLVKFTSHKKNII